VHGALRVQVRFGRPAGHQREGHLREQDGLQVRLRLDRVAQPGINLGPAGLGNRVPLAIGPVTRLGVADEDLAVPGQPPEGRVNLPERRLLATPEILVVIALEVISMAWLALKQPEQRQRHAHASDYSSSVYIEQVWDFPAQLNGPRQASCRGPFGLTGKFGLTGNRVNRGSGGEP
jgi:hypothetical protein